MKRVVISSVAGVCMLGVVIAMISRSASTQTAIAIASNRSEIHPAM